MKTKKYVKNRKGLMGLVAGVLPTQTNCPHVIDCVSKTTPNCIPDYRRCMVYKFYERYGVDADYIGV